MSNNGFYKYLIVFTSLHLCPSTTHADYLYHRPTMKIRQHMSHQTEGNNSNETIIHSKFHTRSTGESHNHKARGYEGQIVYPEELKMNCVHGLCDNVAGYPIDSINQLLQRSQFATNYFQTLKKHGNISIDISNRFNTDEMTLCETTSSIRFPQRANNSEKKEKMIVNTEQYKQRVLIETCASENNECKMNKNFPIGYTSYCKQKYMQIPLMIFGDDNNLNNFTFDVFQIPSCCVCVVKRTG